MVAEALARYAKTPRNRHRLGGYMVLSASYRITTYLISEKFGAPK